MLFLFPEKIELSEKKAEDDQVDLIGWKNNNKPCEEFDPEGGRCGNSQKIKQRPSYIDDGRAGD